MVPTQPVLLTVDDYRAMPKTGLDKESKRKVYVREGVEELWILAPGTKTVALFRLREDPARPKAFFGLKQVFGSAYFPGLKLRVRDIFRE